ncbi:glyoxylase I 4-like [Humulus lupulus]|uniref:glyoxylase I 4-like n=1 Tax=Humulus lupulus TaxID=3486 RepID=UPI002B415CAB|nr:glyoxylase I 4-like [Humulus lupulus]
MGSLGSEISEEYSNGDLIVLEEESSSWSSNNGFNNGNNNKLPLLSLNHVSYVCKSVAKSVKFYEEVLGFVLIKRPSSFKFEGAWLFNYGIGIHLLEAQSGNNKKTQTKKINPKDNHISFQCSDMSLVMQKLAQLNIHYVTAVVEEGGIVVDQLFFHDPDGHMIEICNCQNLPVLPLVASSSSCPLKKSKPTTTIAAAAAADDDDAVASSVRNRRLLEKKQCCAEAAVVTMMDNLVMDMMNIYL